MLYSPDHYEPTPEDWQDYLATLDTDEGERPTEGFRVTYEIVTPASAAEGDAEERGWIHEEPVDLREAIDAWGGMGCEVDADCCPVSRNSPPRWFTAYKVNDGTRDYYETGAEESRGLHLPDTITPSSALRIARLVGCYGVR